MLLLVISFVAGVLTVLAPCILPLLPMIIGRSLSDARVSHRRLFTVIFSLGASVILFTLILKASAVFINIPQDFWKWISGGIIFLFGLTMVFPAIWEKFSFANTISLKSNQVLAEGYQKNSIWGDVIIGASLGPIFSACSPTYFVILATVLPATPVLGMIYLLVYVSGLCLALLFVAFIGQKIMNKIGIMSDSRGRFKRVMGVIFIIVALAIITGYDKKFQISLLDAGFFDVTKIEQNLLEKNDKANDLENTAGNAGVDSDANDANSDTNTVGEIPKEKASEVKFLSIKEKSKKFILAPEISTPDGFINTNGEPVSLAQYKGKKVVLLDIWTYSCINCQRTIPYLNEWYKKYEDEGLVIIGLHTPEFAFERVQKNVEDAVKKFNIKYPVVLDNDFSTWQALHNQYWPRKYLIDIDGFIVYDHAGEGAYSQTEEEIQKALAERASIMGDVKVSSGIVVPAGVVPVNSSKVKSYETYFGSSRNEYLTNGEANKSGEQKLEIPSEILLNNLYLSGTWDFTPEYATTQDNGAKIIYKYNAKDLYFVASSEAGANLKIILDGEVVTAGKGEDVKDDGTVFVKENRLYKIIQGLDYGEHTLEIEIENGTLNAYTFTFG